MTDKQKTKANYILPISLLALGAVAGYFLAQKTGNETVHTEPQDNLLAQTVEVKEQQPKLSSNDTAQVANTLAEQQKSGDDAVKEGGSLAELNGNNNEMAEGIDQLIRLAYADGPVDFAALGKSKQAIVSLAKKDTRALDELILAYSENLSNAMVSNQLSQLISQIKDPKVESLAIQLAESNDRAQRIAGFDLMAELAIPSQRSLTLSSEALQQHQDDKELVLSALHALPKMSLPAQDNREIIELLSELANNDNEAIRSESLITIASWAKTEDELQAVVQALSSDTNDDKISAAMALEQSTVTGDELKLTLLARMSDNNELWEVRSMAANALDRFQLNDGEFSSLTSFRKNQRGGVAQ